MNNNKDILKKIIIISVPIVIQNLLIRSFGTIDSIMVGSLGVNSIAGISICNQMYSYGDLLGGICGGIGIFIAQYNGNKQINSVKRTLSLGILINLSVAIILTVISFLFKTTILSFFSTDKNVLKEAESYFSVFLFSYVFTAMTYCLSRCLKSCGKTIFPLIFTLISLSINTGLNYILIFGKFDFPELGVKGAAIATLISRIFEFVLYIVLIQEKKETNFFWREVKNIKKDFAKLYIKISLPVMLQSVSWALGSATINLFYARMGTSSFAALNIIWIIEGIVFSIISGLGVAASCIVGEEIGRNGKSNTLKDLCNLMILTDLVLSIILSGGIYFWGNSILTFYNITEDLVAKFNFMKTVLVCILPIKTLNSILNQGILKSGADTKYTFYAGLLAMWGICIPLQLIMYAIHGNFYEYVYIIAISEEVAKFIFYITRYKSNKWVIKITNQEI